MRRLRKDAELLRIIHITDEEALAIADAIMPLKQKPAVKTGMPCNRAVAGHHLEYCTRPLGHSGDCDPDA